MSPWLAAAAEFTRKSSIAESGSSVVTQRARRWEEENLARFLR